MAIFDAAATGLATVASGGLFGLLGAVVGAGAKYLERKQKAAGDREERSHELALLQLETERGDRDAENELRIHQADADAAMRTGSYAMPVTVSGVPGWVNAVRSLFRPFLTLALNATAAVILVLLITSLGDDSAPIILWLSSEGPATELITYMVHSLLFAANTATVWWFGDRALTPPGQKNA
ncbi:MAG: hypothetical protein AAF442_09695 [Pseudomonadota bacterium]